MAKEELEKMCHSLPKKERKEPIVEDRFIIKGDTPKVCGESIVDRIIKQILRGK